MKRDKTDFRGTEQARSRGRGRYGERRLADKVNGVVVGRSKFIRIGKRTFSIDCQQPPDVITVWASFESKWLKSAPKNISKVMTQAVRNAPEGLVPVGVIGDRTARCVYYIMMESDFISFHVGKKR